MAGFTDEPDMNDRAQAHVHRVMEAVQRDYADDPQVPRFIVFVEMPPDGRVAIASTGDDAVDTLRIAVLALGTAKSGARAEGHDPDALIARWAREHARSN